MPHQSESGRGKRKRLKWIGALAVLLIAGVMAFLWNGDVILFPEKQTATLLVLEDCDSDFRTPPFEDIVTAFGPSGVWWRTATNLNICQTVGGGRALAVSADGSFFVVCEMVGKHLKAYEMRTGKPLWSVDGEFTAATVHENGSVYAVISSGTIYGERTVVIDKTGSITKDGSAAGFDMALDAERNTLWLVGKHLKKCDLELNLIREFSPIKWCGVSVDVNPDGSVWVAEREHPDVAQSTDRIFKVSPEGQILRSVGLEFSPLCLRVDPSDGSVWVTGIGIRTPVAKRILDSIERRTGTLPLGKTIRAFLTERRAWSRTHKYDSEGTLLRDVNEGGHSIDIQRSDGSVWVAGKEKIYRLSCEGTKRARIDGVSAEQKYVVVVPEKLP